MAASRGVDGPGVPDGRFPAAVQRQAGGGGQAGLREPNGPVEWSRRAIINVVDALGTQTGAVTVVGGHAVQIRTENLGIEILPTTDGDLAVTPGLVTDEVSIGGLMVAAGYVSRDASRPGLWGRGTFTDGNGATRFREQVDLAVPFALSGARNARKRSTPALSQVHGKMSTSNTSGLELATKDRSEIEIVDLAEPSISRIVNVAGIPALLVAKAQKVSERMSEPGARRLKTKDLGDVWRLLASATPDSARTTIETHLADADIGAAVSAGLGHLRRVLSSRFSTELAYESLRDSVSRKRIEQDFGTWSDVFG